MDIQEFAASLSVLEHDLDRLRARYEQYFQGIERTEPQRFRTDLQRRLRELLRATPRNTALRFRMHTLQQRYVTYEQYWNRICRQIEEGTYRRDLQRARRRKQTREQMVAAASGRPAHDLDLDVDVEEALRSAEAAATAAAAHKGEGSTERTAPPVADGRRDGGEESSARKRLASLQRTSPSAGAFSDDRIRRIYAEYIEARRQNNEPIDNVSYSKVAQSIRAMAPKLQRKHRGKQIDFQVVVQNGRVGLKPVPRG